jgi:predicted nucleic acid-binding protein
MAIVNEKRGRRIARYFYDLALKGNAVLLVEAKQGPIDDLRTSLMELKAAGYFLSNAVIERACAAVRHP